MIDFNLKAKTIYFRLVEEADAEFICELRADPTLNIYLSASVPNVDAQRKWITQYKIRESARLEYYFIICKNDHTAIGTVRLYDFQTDLNSFCWGSWILNKDKTKFAAIESAMLVYQAGFEILDFAQCHFDVMKRNDRVQSFHLKMGAQQISEDKLNFYYTLSKAQHDVNKLIYSKFFI